MANANILLVKNAKGMNAASGRQVLASNSWRRFDVEFITPDNHVFKIPAGMSIVKELNRQAEEQGIKINAADYLTQFEKMHNIGLKLAGQIDSKARTAKQGAPELEYDNLIITLDSQANADPAIAKKINDIVLTELRSVKCDIPSDDYTWEGLRPVFTTDEHTNTGHSHKHCMLNRMGHGVDPVTGRAYMTKAIGMDDRSVMDTIEKRINDKLQAAGIQFTFAVADANNVTQANSAIAVTAKNNAANAVLAAGGAINSATVAVPEAQGMVKQSITFKSEAEDLFKQAESLRVQAEAKAAAAAKLDQAVQVMNENDQLKTDLEATNTELATTKENAEKAIQDLNTELESTKEEASQAIQAKQEQINDIGTVLSVLAPEVADELKRGDFTVLTETLDTVVKKLDTWNDAIGSLDDTELAVKIENNPTEELQNIVTDLKNKAQTVTELTAERGKLTSENTVLSNTLEKVNATVAELTTEKTTLQGRITQIENDNERLTAEKAAKDADWRDEVRKNGRLEAERDGLKTDLGTAKETIKTLETQNANLSLENNVLTISTEKLAAALDKAQDTIAADKKANDELLEKLARLEKQLGDFEVSMKAEKATHAGQVQALNAELNTANTKLTSANNHVQALSTTETKLRGEVKELKANSIGPTLSTKELQTLAFLKAAPQIQNELYIQMGLQLTGGTPKLELGGSRLSPEMLEVLKFIKAEPAVMKLVRDAQTNPYMLSVLKEEYNGEGNYLQPTDNTQNTSSNVFGQNDDKKDDQGNRL
jgi:hypothetical protein